VPDCTPDRSLTDNLEGFEARVDCFRRYAVAAIRDGCVQGDKVTVRVGRKIFLLICEHSIKAAEQVGNHAYAAMMRRQCEQFERALSAADQAASPSLEKKSISDAAARIMTVHKLAYVANGMLFYMSFQPGGSDAPLRSMPSHELLIRYFVSCAAEGMSFYKAMDSLWGPRNQTPDAGLSS
jgi:hypothetical protein